MSTQSLKPYLVLAAALSLSACAKYEFTPVDLGDSDKLLADPMTIAAKTMKMNSSQATFKQSSFESNDTSISFQVVDTNGNYVNDLESSVIEIVENGVVVGTVDIRRNQQSIQQTVDIAFMMDVTCSMSPSLAQAKTSVIDFVQTTRANGHRTRMCLATFGDDMVTRCTRFYDNNPADPETMSQVQEFVSQVSQLRALCYSEDPGGPTRDENPMGAIIDTANAPWADGAQRMGILLTDAGFVYAPGNDIGLVPAPRYTQVLDALRNSQMSIFAATPSQAGYNSAFQGLPSIVGASNGEFFLYSDLIAGRTSFNSILERIMDRVQTTYVASYSADEVPGLDPALPLSERTIQVRLRGRSDLVVTVTSTTSSMPQGRPRYTKTWTFSDQPVDPLSVVVKVNGKKLTAGYTIHGGQVTFAQAPAANADIEVQYRYKNIRDNLNVESLTLDGRIDRRLLSLYLNGIPADADVIFTRNLQNDWVVSLSNHVLSEADPYGIRARNGLDLEIKWTAPPTQRPGNNMTRVR